jgi:hypothetical protein
MIAIVWLAAAGCALAETVAVPAGVDHAPFDRLLQAYVDDHGRVDYSGWKKNAADLKSLREYVTQFSIQGPQANGTAKIASLINAYNALTLLWVLDHYPVKSITDTPDPWTAKRHRVGGRLVSLDELEHDALRPLAGYRVHAVLVCAARSCPPLWNRAYTAENLDQQLDEAMRRWLAREDLNGFMPSENRVELSKIFEWYGTDFDRAEGGLKGVLRRFGPEKSRAMWEGDYRVTYRDYDWSLNGVESID